MDHHQTMCVKYLSTPYQVAVSKSNVVVLDGTVNDLFLKSRTRLQRHEGFVSL